MRIERVQASAHKKGRVLVFLEDGACLKITEQEALDFGLRTGDDLDGRRLEQLKKAASVSNVKATAADLIGKRAMSRRDLERKLQEKGASQAEARYAAEWRGHWCHQRCRLRSNLGAPLRRPWLWPGPHSRETAGERRTPGAVGRGSGSGTGQRLAD